MNKITVQLKEGTVAVRPLFLYEDDLIPFEDVGDFTFNYILDLQSGQTKPVVHTLADFQEIPLKPDKPRTQCQPGSEEYDLWDRWTLYQAIIAHELKRLEIAEQHAHDITRYVLENCLSVEDRQKIITPDDLARVLVAALCSEITLEEVETALAVSFQSIVEWAKYYAGHLLAARQQVVNFSAEVLGSQDAGEMAVA